MGYTIDKRIRLYILYFTILTIATLSFFTMWQYKSYHRSSEKMSQYQSYDGTIYQFIIGENFFRKNIAVEIFESAKLVKQQSPVLYAKITDNYWEIISDTITDYQWEIKANPNEDMLEFFCPKLGLWFEIPFKLMPVNTKLSWPNFSSSDYYMSVSDVRKKDGKYLVQLSYLNFWPAIKPVLILNIIAAIIKLLICYLGGMLISSIIRGLSNMYIDRSWRNSGYKRFTWELGRFSKKSLSKSTGTYRILETYRPLGNPNRNFFTQIYEKK